MKIKRFAAILGLLLCFTVSASAADLLSLDTVLEPLLVGQDTVSLSATMQLKALMPFDDTRIDLINRVLGHVTLNARVEQDGADETTAFQLTMGETTLLEMTEQLRSGAYLLQTTLLPNRMLFSTQGSPMDMLLAASDGEADTTDETETTLNTSAVETAFDMQAAVDELEACYRALIDQTVSLATKNTPNYTIDNIGRGRISYVAKLTTEQSTALQAEIRTVLSCGMDDAYREELSQVTFASGFVVALYQNEDAEDICVYIRGTIVYPDGDKRDIKWQWAFTPDGETQTLTYEAARQSGTRDSRVIDALLKRTEDEDSFTLSGKVETNLRRSSVNETSTLTLDLRGSLGDTPTCTGSLNRLTEATSGGESTGETETTVTVDVSLLNGTGGAELSGTAEYLYTKDETTQTNLVLTFTPATAVVPASTDGTEETAEAEAPTVEISIISADPTTAGENAETPTVTVEETQTEQPEFLVGTAPTGLYDYEIPAEMTTINMDSTEQKVHQSLLNEASQRLAGNLVTAILDLPADDRALLADGMTDEDYAIFLAMFD